jgi:UDPglucose 6-dehydrogenase
VEEAKAFYLKDVANITYVNSNYEALVIAGALILLTEWKELHSPVMMK